MRLQFGLCLSWVLCYASARYAPVGVSKLEEVFSWNQITYNIDGRSVLTNKFSYQEPVQSVPKRTGDTIAFPESTDDENERSTVREEDRFFIQYNNVPMGIERWKDKLFVTMPRRRYGIPSTLNYISLTEDIKTKSPGLRPYPSLILNNYRPRTGPAPRGYEKSLVSVYRTRVDACDRLWMVDTGLLEIPNARRQIQPPAIVIYDLNTSHLVSRYEFKNGTDIINQNTPAGLASITVDIVNNDCSKAFAYIPDLATYGLIVYDFEQNDSWRVTHNYFSFNPLVGDMTIAGQSFQWRDGIFSIQLLPVQEDGFRHAIFHPMVSTHEFSVSTRVLTNRQLATRTFHGNDFTILGDKGPNTQTTMHGYSEHSGVVLFAEVGRDAISCWSTRKGFSPENQAIVAQDHKNLIYPSDLHIDGDNNVWIMANTMPLFIYSNLDTRKVNFRIYKANIQTLVAGTICDSTRFN